MPDPPKPTLRRALRKKLRTHSGNSPAVAEKVSRFLASRPELKTIATFAALPGEVDLSSLFENSRRWLFPRVTGHDLTFHHVRDPQKDLLPGFHGIPEPRENLPSVPIPEIDCFLCPGLGFAQNGSRLGRGKGFYDRALTHARPNALKIGVCFTFQILDHLRTEPHDIPMDLVLHA